MKVSLSGIRKNTIYIQKDTQCDEHMVYKLPFIALLTIKEKLIQHFSCIICFENHHCLITIYIFLETKPAIHNVPYIAVFRRIVFGQLQSLTDLSKTWKNFFSINLINKLLLNVPKYKTVDIDCSQKTKKRTVSHLIDLYASNWFVNAHQILLASNVFHLTFLRCYTFI